MDLSKSQLNKFVPAANLLNTNKMYFGKFLCRAELYIPAAHLMRWIGKKTFGQFTAEVERHRKYATDWLGKHPNDTWATRRKNEVLTCNIAQLYVLYTICKDYKDQNLIRTRIEGRAFQVYAVSEEILTEVLTLFGAYATNFIAEIRLPANTEIKDKLVDNVIFMNKPPYSYRVSIRDANYSLATKQQILEYLSNYPIQIKIPTGLKKKLRKECDSYLRGYYYLDDLTILTFLKMISSNFVGKIFKLERIVE